MAFDFIRRRDSFDFRLKPANLVVSAFQKDLEIYIGIDFGTTFSKVSFQVGDQEGTTKYSIRFGYHYQEEDYCLPSVLGYNSHSRTLIFTQEPEKIGGAVPVKYFKYSIIEKGVPRDVDDLREGRAENDPQRLCSAFYLGHLLRNVKKKILEHKAVKGRSKGVRWYVNMGVPVSDFAAKPKPIYDEVLNVAWQLSEFDVLETSWRIDELDRFYSKYVSHSTWSDRLNTVPELYAEIIMFLQAKTTDSGFYAVIDIGGGTMDLAIFLKRIDMYRHETEIYCVAQDVCPLGYEMYKLVHDQNAANKKIRMSYGECLERGRQNHKTEMQKLFRKGGLLEQFYMGGARKVSVYHDIINETDNAYVRIWSQYPGCTENNIIDFMRGKFRLEVSGNPRLVISQMLAQPFEKMPSLVGQEWNKGVCVPGKTPSLQELQDHLYGI